MTTQQHVEDVNAKVLEADAENILRAITPSLDSNRHKGQAGKIAVVGGCREYTGAPYFSAISALKINALREEDRESVSRKVVAEVDKWMERFDCLVVGPGLGRDPFLLDCVSEIMKHARDAKVPIVADGDGLFLVTNCLDLVSGYPLAVLTPNVNEYKRLVQKVLNCDINDDEAAEELISLSRRIGGATILRKGKSDLISDGTTVHSVSIYGSPRRCGGQGDILSGSVALFLSWARQHISANGNINIKPGNPAVLGCIAGSALMRKAASLAFYSKKRSTLTTDIIEYLGESLEEIVPVDSSRTEDQE